MTCLRRVLDVSRLDKIRNTKIKESLNLDQDVLNRTETKRLKYFGHVKRMQPTRYPKMAMEGNVKGHRPRGRPPKRWLDCISQDCKTRSITNLTRGNKNGHKQIAHSHENGSSSGFFVLWSNNPCSLHKICNHVNFLLDLDKIYMDIYSFLYF